jgi:hypothetical protein
LIQRPPKRAGTVVHPCLKNAARVHVSICLGGGKSPSSPFFTSLVAKVQQFAVAAASSLGENEDGSAFFQCFLGQKTDCRLAFALLPYPSRAEQRYLEGM